MTLYLDHAATSWPKPQAVLDAMAAFYSDFGVSAARGSSSRCAAVARRVDDVRARTARLCGMPHKRTAFTSGATESLNLLLRALLRPGDTAMTTAFEHSSVVRPLLHMQRERGVQVHVLEPDADFALRLDQVAEALTALRPRLLVFTHASNVTGALLPAAELCEMARRHGTLSLLDASQTAGHCPIDVGADAIAFSAHKALLGPPGLGVAAVREGLELAPQKQGGTGSSEALDRHPTRWPEAFEAGTPNTPAIFGLGAALALAEEPAQRARCAAALAATEALEEALAAIPGIRLLRPAGPRMPTLSVVHETLDPLDLAALLDADDIHARAGHHCAPWIHRRLGVEATGTLRLSPGPDLSAADIRRVSAALLPS